MTKTYRAAYISSPGTAGVVLTRPEHAELPDDDLMAEAMAELKRADPDDEYGTTEEDIVIGMWTE